MEGVKAQEVQMQTEPGVVLKASLVLPERARGLVLFAHGSGSSRHSPRNRYVAGVLQEGGLATLLFDLLTANEERVDRVTRHLRFDIGLLARRLAGATAGRWRRLRLRTTRWVILAPARGPQPP